VETEPRHAQPDVGAKANEDDQPRGDWEKTTTRKKEIESTAVPTSTEYAKVVTGLNAPEFQGIIRSFFICKAYRTLLISR